MVLECSCYLKVVHNGAIMFLLKVVHNGARMFLLFEGGS